MMKLILTAAVAAGLAAGAAGAATLDFVGYPNASGEQGVANGTTIVFDGLPVTFNANSTYSPYFDSSSPSEVQLGGGGAGCLQGGPGEPVQPVQR